VIRHLLATDLRRFRWTLTAWVVLLVAYGALLWVMPDTVGRQPRYETLGTALALLFFVVHFAPLVLVPVIVQADAAVGSDVFWVTRPIPPRALLAAKAILLALVIVIPPALLELAAMTAAHVPGPEITRIAMGTVLSSTVWLALLLAAAAVTPTYPKFALLGVSVVVSFAAWLVVYQAIVRSGAEGAVAMLSVAPVPVPESPDATNAVVFMVGLILSCCAALVVQYQRRQRTVSVPTGAGAVALAFLAASWWRWPLLPPSIPLPEWTAGVRITAAAGATFDPPASWMRPETPRVGRLPMRIDGVPPAWFASASLRDGTYTLADGSLVRTLHRGMSAWLPFEGTNEPPQRVAVRRLLSVNRLADRLPTQGDSGVATVASAGDIQRLQSMTAVYRGSFAVAFSHAEIAGVVPLRSGTTFDTGVYQLRLRDMIAAGPNSVTFNGIETQATSMFDSPAGGTYTLYALNRARSEAIEGLSVSQGELADFAGFGVHASFGVGQGFSRRGVAIVFPLRTLLPETLVIDDDWLRAAELVVVRTRQTGHVMHAIEVPGVRVLGETPKIK
jgi:hypothetical protein